jgi:hypothetical protein
MATMSALMGGEQGRGNKKGERAPEEGSRGAKLGVGRHREEEAVGERQRVRR